ncbi:60Kd inner membrane protein [Teratosphaeria destructans]|uniref:60Kd inner membrane protein n=1 Tax=Teratosphaeria destructans TaxID=418781 RepID=A0A9W7SI13_9PEZI|nr:60Kd inner membrane protein [Teratosphaeria destructans]
MSAHDFLSESQTTFPSDSENYDANHSNQDSSDEPPSSSASPMILYQPPTIWGILRGAAINVLLPFVNGLMLGFGELFAHEAAFRLGWSNTKVRRCRPARKGVEAGAWSLRSNTHPMSRKSTNGLKVFPSHRNSRSIGPGVEIRDDPIERRRRNGQELDAYTSLDRGIIARGNAPRLSRLQQRNFSSTPRIASRIPNRPRVHASALQSRPWQNTAPLAALTAASVRHLSWWGSSSSSLPPPPSTATSNAIPTPSTAPPVEAASPPPPPPPPLETSTTGATGPEGAFSNLDTITLDSSDIVSAAAQAPDTIGYLKSLGLGDGYVTPLLQFVLEHIHVYTGLPWWGSIAATAIVLRFISLPFYVKASDQNARAAALVSVTKPVSDRLFEAMRNGDSTTALQLRQQLGAIRARAGLSHWQALQPSIYQGVIGFCGFRLIRSMVEAPVPGLKDGGFLWLSDLTVSDPYGIMPLVMAAAVHLLFRFGGESGSMTVTPELKPILYYAAPGAMLFIMGFQPGALCVWFAASGAVGMAQGRLLQNPAVRRYLGLAPIYKPAAGEATPLDSLLDRFHGQASGNQSSSQRDAPRSTKSEPFMSPRYQAPTLRTRPSSTTNRVIDVKPVQKSQNSTAGDDMISANRPVADTSDGNVGRVKKAWSKLKEDWSEKVKREGEKRKLDNRRKAAEEYERRAQERRGR